MGFVIITTLAILFGPGLFLIIAAYDVEDMKPKWKKPLLRAGVFFLIIGMLLLLLLFKACRGFGNTIM